jgi:hypothetical protein
MATMKKTIFKSLVAFASTATLVLPALSSKVALSQNIPPDNKFEIRLRTFIPSPAVYAASPAPALDLAVNLALPLSLQW